MAIVCIFLSNWMELPTCIERGNYLYKELMKGWIQRLKSINSFKSMPRLLAIAASKHKLGFDWPRSILPIVDWGTSIILPSFSWLIFLLCLISLRWLPKDLKIFSSRVFDFILLCYKKQMKEKIFSQNKSVNALFYYICMYKQMLTGI